MSAFGRKITAAAIAISLCAVPTAAIGASPSPAAVPVAAAPTNPWLTLSAMTTSSSAATSATATAEQGYDDGLAFPPAVPLVVILATVAMAIYILTRDDDDGNLSPISPA